jgi:cytochrome c-type biogenesis protein CcmH
MTAFLAAAVAMTAVAVLLLVRPLLARRMVQDVERAGANLAILRDQLAELDNDLRAGTLEEAQYREAKAELERRVLAEVKAERAAAPPAPVVPSAGKRMAALAALALPVAAAGLYWQLGTRGALGPEKLAAMGGATQGEQHAISPEQLEEIVGRLAARLEQEPDNAQGWSILARSYYMMKRFPEAAAAYERLAKLAPADADVLADYADALAMAQGRKLTGRPMEIVEQALKADPKHSKSLALAGTAAFDRKDYRRAVEYWERMLTGLPADSPLREPILASIAEARELGGLKAGPVAKAPATQAAPAAPAAASVAGGTRRIEGTVALAPAIAAKADPNDTVFIFARAAEGPRMPLAIVRKQVKDLPAAFSLDDSMAMTPGLSLATHPRVVVSARVSKAANATPQPGDLEGQSAPIEVGAGNVAIVIDKVLP